MKTTDVKAYSNGKDTGIQVFVCKDYDALSAKAAAIVSGEINKKARFILGLATGTSPIGLYTNLAELNAEGKVDFSGVTTYNLDEYYPIAPEHDQSYRYFMNKYLFNKVNIDMANTHLLNGLADDPDAECKAYDDVIEAAGGVDLQVLGIGRNGHIGFNEPGDKFIMGTHVVTLTEDTIDANSRLFNNADEVPRKALSMGIKTIMNAKQIVLVANGKNKAKAIKDALEGEVTPWCQASVLQLRKNVVFVLDEDAASELTEYKPL